MQRVLRIFLAALIAPLTTIPVSLVVGGLYILIDTHGQAGSILSGTKLLAAAAAMIAYMVTIFLGIPIYCFIFKKWAS